MAKRSLKGVASSGSARKRYKSSSATSEPHETQSLLTQWIIPSPEAKDTTTAQTLASTRVDSSFQEPTHSTTASGSLHAQGSSGSVTATQRVEKRHESETQQPIQDGHTSGEDLTVVTTLDLPTKVLEMILCQVNIQDLYFSCRLVCKRWNDIVMREKVHADSMVTFY